MKLTTLRIRKFQNFIFDWWDIHKRDLPWRHTHDPYAILVSEVMLQQTQVSRVLSKYEDFLYFFPDVYALARASSAVILKVWKGMGYNRRALYLKKTAEAIVRQYHGEFPMDEKPLTQLPGLGTYTARAILVFAFGQNVAMVDTNIRQIITHFFFRDKPQKNKVIQDVAGQLLPIDKSWEWHQALMDYGALALDVRGKSIVKKQKPFKESNRYFRGRIMDLLRERGYKETSLLDHLTKTYNKPRGFFIKLLASLARDGLISRSKGKISLPQ